MDGLARALTILGIGAVMAAFAAAPADAYSSYFSGTLPAGGSQTLSFIASERGDYQASVRLDSGSLLFDYGGQSQAVGVTGARIDLGVIDAGAHEVVLTGGPASYDVTVSEQAPRFADLRQSTKYVQPGGTVGWTFTLSSPAILTLKASGPEGVALPPNGQRLNADAGPFGINWQLRDASGAPLPEGYYDLQVDAKNGAGTTSAWPEVDVGVDGTPPSVSIRPPRDLGSYNTSAYEPVLVDFNDGVPGQFGSGIEQVAVSADGGPTTIVPREYTGWYYFPPGGSWSPSREHTVEAVATDRAGNTAMGRTSFWIPAAPTSTGRPNCSTLAVKTAVRDSKQLNAGLRRVEHMPHGDLFTRFLIQGRACSVLSDNFNVDRASDLVVLLAEQHGPRTVLAIFRPQAGGGWSLAFQDYRHRIASLKSSYFDARLTLQPQGRHEARQVEISFDGKRFVLKPIEGQR